MASVAFDGRRIDLAAGETALDGLLRSGIQIAHSCKGGACQSCLMKCLEGALPTRASEGLQATLRETGHFLACQCIPDQDLMISLPTDGAGEFSVELVQREMLCPQVMGITLTHPDGFEYRAGQFVHLLLPNGQSRSYSLASVPELDEHLHLQVKLIPGGQASEWLSSGLALGNPISIRGPLGNCFYTADRPDLPMILAGVGSGLAPLYGIARDALAQGHMGEICLVHGAVTSEGNYLHAELSALTERYPIFRYVPVALQGEPAEGGVTGAVDSVVREEAVRMVARRAYVCGDPEIVKVIKRHVFLAGVSMKEIYSDPFLPASTSR